MRTDLEKKKSDKGIDLKNETEKSSSAMTFFVLMFAIPLLLIILSRVILG